MSRDASSQECWHNLWTKLLLELRLGWFIARGWVLVLPAFELLRPKTLDEALDLLSQTADARPLAGGTNLIVDMRSGKLRPATLVDIGGLQELCCIREKDGHLLIGGGVTLAELLDDPMIERDVPILTAMARSFGNTLIRNRATIGGNLVNAAPCSDTAPALLVLDAEVELASAAGTRRMPIGEFFVGAFETKRQPNELLTCVRVPVSPAGARTAFEKMGLRKISCMAKVDVAVRVDLDESGVVTNVRIAVGAASAVALRVLSAEEALIGQPLAAVVPASQGLTGEQRFGKGIEEAVRLVGEAVEPRAVSEYTRQVVRGITRRLLESIADREVGL
ncbi:MAG: xanthine dehydrogenase family protein subunit M [Candidatus Bipolaricaulia bacterium]